MDNQSAAAASDHREERSQDVATAASMDDGIVAGLRTRLNKTRSAGSLAASLGSEVDDLDEEAVADINVDVDEVGSRGSIAAALKRGGVGIMASLARFEDEISVSQSSRAEVTKGGR